MAENKDLQEYQKWCEEKGLNPLDSKNLDYYNKTVKVKTIKFGELVKDLSDYDIPEYISKDIKAGIKEMISVVIAADSIIRIR